MAYAICNVSMPGHECEIFTSELSRIGFKESSYYSYVIELDKSRKYMLGIDQSPNCTGLSLVSDNFDTILVFTIPIDDVSASKYVKYFPLLEEFLICMLDGIGVVYVAYENVPPIKYKNQKILHEMKGTIETWLQRVPSLKKLDPSWIFVPYPNTWKGFVYDKKDKGPGRVKAFNNKEEISRDIVKKMPVLEKYFKYLQTVKKHDFDGMDAFGMVFSARFMYLSPEWDLMNKDATVQLGKFYVVFKYLSVDQIALESSMSEIKEDHMFWGLVPFIQLDKVDRREWNNSYSIYQNYVMAANTGKIIIMECVDTRHILATLIESRVGYDPSKTLFCYIFKATVVSDSVVSVIGGNGVLMKRFY